MEQTLFEDNPHWSDTKAYSHLATRQVLQKAISYMETKHIIALVGARRVGKSSIAKLMIGELLKSVEAKNICFVNLEKPEFIPYKNDASYIGVIFDEYLKLADPDRDKRIYLFLDEVQIFANWEVFLKSKYENSNIKFIITGSNSSLLSSDLATVLSGRVLRLTITSFSFSEFLLYKGIGHATKLQMVENRVAISRAKDEYLKWGGYFDVISTNSDMLRRDLLKNIVEDIILKDIVPRYSIKNSQQIRDLFYYVASNASSLLNYATLARKIGIDAKSIKEYIEYFEDNFLLYTIPAYHQKLATQIRSTKKIYLSDTGFLNLGVKRSQNFGAMLENAVAIDLKRECEDLGYVKERLEVDFLCDDELLQVSYNIDDEKTRDRELRAFSAFDPDKKYRHTLVTYDRSASRSTSLESVLSYEEFALLPR